MKKLLVLALLCLPFLGNSQIVNEKNVKDWGYGENKIKKAPKKIYVKDFFVNYQVLSSNSETTTNSDLDRATSMMSVGLVGLETEDFQEITDAAYKRMVGKLTDAGYEIVGSEEAAKAEMFQDYTKLTGGTPSQAQIIGYISTAPTGYDYYVKKVTNKGKAKDAFFDVTPKLSKELGDIPVLEANVSFQFVTIEGSSFAGAAKMKGNVNFVLAATAIGTSSEGFFGSKIETSPSLERVVWKGGAVGAGALSIIQFSPKSDISIEGVVEQKKFKEYVSSNSYKPSYANIVITQDKKIEVSHQVKADREAYKTKSLQALNEYLDQMIQKLLDSANG